MAGMHRVYKGNAGSPYMTCKNCKEKPVFVQISNVPLCRQHFIRYFEKKVLYTIKKFSIINKNDKIVAALSGGKGSTTILYILNELSKKTRHFTLSALLIDEGIKNYRDKTKQDAIDFCKKNKISLEILSYKKDLGNTLDEMLKKVKQKPCSICGVFRRYLLNKGARNLHATKLATGHNLDDEAQSILMNQFRRNNETSARLGPITGILKDKQFIPRIKPLYLLTEKEVAIYAFLKQFPVTFTECPNAPQGYRGDVRIMLNQLESKYPGTKHSIVNTFLENLPYLKESCKTKSTLNYCKICKEPTSKEICQACVLLNEIKKKNV